MLVRIILLCGSVLLVTVHAQTPLEACLRDFATVLQPEHSFSTDFRMKKHLPGLNTPLPAQGRAVFAPEQGLIWETTFPLQDVRVFGKERFAASSDTGEMIVREIQSTGRIAELMMQPREALLKALEQTFFVTCSKKQGTYSVILSPKPGTLAKFLTEVALQSSENRLQQVTITQADGTVARITFENTTVPADLSETDKGLFSLVR